MTQPDVCVGNQVDFMLQPKIYFGVVRNMKVGDTFTSLEITSALTEYDLSNFPNGNSHPQSGTWLDKECNQDNNLLKFVLVSYTHVCVVHSLVLKEYYTIPCV